MILRRDASEEHLADELDDLIRRVLRERVARVSPSPRVWERISARAERSESWRAVSLGLSRGYREAIAPLLRLDAFLSVQYAPWKWPQDEWVEWRHNPWITRLIDQYSYVLKLAF